MQRHHPSYFHGMICAILTLFISGCAPINPPPTAVPGISHPSSSSTPQSTSTPHPGTQPTLEITPGNPDAFQSTAILLATIAPTGPTLPATASCLPAEIDQYMNVVLPLTDEHTVDSSEAQKMETITDETQIQALRKRAMARLESIRGIQALPCLREAERN